MQLSYLYCYCGRTQTCVESCHLVLNIVHKEYTAKFFDTLITILLQIFFFNFTKVTNYTFLLFFLIGTFSGLVESNPQVNIDLPPTSCLPLPEPAIAGMPVPPTAPAFRQINNSTVMDSFGNFSQMSLSPS